MARAMEHQPFPDDDAGREDLRILLDHYSVSNPLRMKRIVEAWAPWLVGPQRDALIDDKMRFPRFWKTQELGNVLNLTEADGSTSISIPLGPSI